MKPSFFRSCSEKGSRINLIAALAAEKNNYMKPFTFLPVVLASLGLVLLDSCSTTQHPGAAASQEVSMAPSTVERPREAWVLRSVLDGRTRALSIALHKKLWIAYSTKNGSLYKAWDGKVLFGGPVYTSSHGPQPVSVGTNYLEEGEANPWRILVDGQEITPEVNYKGHRILQNRVTLKYELVYQGKKIGVEETPEFFETEGDRAGFERSFVTANVPAGVQVGLQMKLSSLLSADDYKTDGRFIAGESKTETLEGRTFMELPGMLQLNNNAKTVFSVNLVQKPAIRQVETQVNQA
jgi:cytochrome c